MQLSEVLYGLLHGLKVTASYGTLSWYDQAPLLPYWKDHLAKAKTKPGVAGKPGKIVAELTFGFWVELLSKSNHNGWAQD